MWSEEEMREIEPEPPPKRTGARSLATALRQTLSARNVERSVTIEHERTRGSTPAVIYTPGTATHGNFIDASYRRILANGEWAARLNKVHTSKRQARPTGLDEETRAWRELDSATSSDALLMNIFCYPGVLASARLPALLGVERGSSPIFGYHPRVPLQRGLFDRTEIDLRLGSLLLEAKLTEADFQLAPMRLLERYLHFDEVFDRGALELVGSRVRSYQLVRGVLAAHAEDATFCVLSDARRPDLADAWCSIMLAVRSYDLRSRLRLLTWQELAAVLPPALRSFLSEKYGIEPS